MVNFKRSMLIWFCSQILSLVSLSLAFSPFNGLDLPLDERNETIRRDEFYVDTLGAKLQTHQSSGGIINPDNIYEWTPIAAQISAGERSVFIFSVDTNSSGLGIAPTYEILIFLSGNICKQPNNSTDKALRVYYSFNDSVTTNSSSGLYATFENGYMQALAISPLQRSDSNTTSKYSNLYVVIEPVNLTTDTALPADPDGDGDIWEYRLSISENDLVFQWDTRSWLDILDTDYNSALLTTGNVTADAQQFSNYSIYDISLYDLYVYSFEESLKFDSSLNISLCAVVNGPYLVSSIGPTEDSNQHNGLDRSNLLIKKSLTNRRGNVQEQFYITGLNSSSTYVAYLTKRIGKKGDLSEVGGVLFSKQIFSTRDTNACSLIFGLEFCSGVAYSVPSPSIAPDNKTFIAQAYDQIAQSLYANFSKALQIIPCDSELDARYSPIRSCKDCASSYRSWLCAVTIPRCSDTESEYYIHRQKDDNRNDYLNELIKPIADYYEILPCIDMCYAIARDCPSDFGFACPDIKEKGSLALNSYNVFDLYNGIDTCNFIGNDTELFKNLDS